MWIVKRLEQHPIASITILVLLMLSLHLDVIPVSIMEARNFITAREMLTEGNWLLTTMNGEPRYQKPPLPSWICAVFASIFGIQNTLAYRLPAVLFVLLSGIFIYVLSKKLNLNKQHSFRNALIFITSFYVIGITFEAPSDIFTHGFMLAGISQLFLLVRSENSHIYHILLSGLFIGLSILSKGPVSFYALLLPFLIAFGLTYKFKFSKRMILSFFMVLIIAIIIGGSWYMYVRLNDPQTFNAIAEKETGNWTSYNVRPFYYYWSFFVQSGLWTIPALIGLLYPYLKSRVNNLKAYQFTLFWTLAAVVLLSIIPEKKSRYLMPVLIPLALNTGFYIDYLIRKFHLIVNKKEVIPVYFNFYLIAILACLVPFIAYAFIDGILGKWIVSYVLTSIVSVCIGVTLIKHLRLKEMKLVFYLTVAFFISLLSFGLPIANASKSDSYKSISALDEELNKKSIKLFSSNELAPEIIWQYGAKIPQLDNSELNKTQINEPFALLSNQSITELNDQFGPDFSFKKQESYNLNFSEEIKDRLMANLYIVKKVN